MSRVVHFFAAQKDMLDLLAEIESTRMIHYVEAGMFERAELIVYASASQIPDLGFIDVQSTVLGRKLLIADATTSFTLRSVPQRDGGVRYAMDQQENPDTLSFFPGGQFDEQTILAGDSGTCTDSPVSVALFKIMSGVVRRRWVKIRGNFVGPEALGVLNAGGRLTDNLRSSQEYDLRQ